MLTCTVTAEDPTWKGRTPASRGCEVCKVKTSEQRKAIINLAEKQQVKGFLTENDQKQRGMSGPSHCLTINLVKVGGEGDPEGTEKKRASTLLKISTTKRGRVTCRC